jgi:hypothetical protein
VLAGDGLAEVVVVPGPAAEQAATTNLAVPMSRTASSDPLGVRITIFLPDILARCASKP